MKLLDILFRSLLGSGTTWSQAERKVFTNLGVSKIQWSDWKPHFIVEVNLDKNFVILQSESGKKYQIKSDKKTNQNLIKGIAENEFLPKYGSEFINEIRSWTYIYFRTKPVEYKVDLRAKLKPLNQTTEKRKKMYHKRNVIVTEFFIKNLMEKTK